MSGLLSGILGVVIIAAGVMTGNPGLIVGGVMLMGSAAAQAGIIGGSIGKFMQSGAGMALMAAVSLGSAAYAMYGASAAEAGAQGAAASAQAAETAPAGTGALASGATASADDSAAAMTNMSFLKTANMGQDVAAMQQADPALASVSGVSGDELATQNAQAMGTGSNASASQAAAQQTASTQGASPLVGKPAMAGQESGATPAAASGAPGSLPPGVQPVDAAGDLQASTGAGPPGLPQAGAGTPPAGGGVSGVLNNALGVINKNPGLAMIGASTIGGIGQGIAQKQSIEDQLKAAQWGNAQWQNAGQVAAMQKAAAAPITVPQGYLERANQVKTLMAGNSGVQPLPTAQPGAPLAPSPLPPPTGHG
jgi:hypothetical protein